MYNIALSIVSCFAGLPRTVRTLSMSMTRNTATKEVLPATVQHANKEKDSEPVGSNDDVATQFESSLSSRPNGAILNEEFELISDRSARSFLATYEVPFMDFCRLYTPVLGKDSGIPQIYGTDKNRTWILEVLMLEIYPRWGLSVSTIVQTYGHILGLPESDLEQLVKGNREAKCKYIDKKLYGTKQAAELEEAMKHDDQVQSDEGFFQIRERSISIDASPDALNNLMTAIDNYR